MSDPTFTIDTPHGKVTLPVAQAMRMGEAIAEFKAKGITPVWHFNDCGECVSVHERDAHEGWVIDQAGGADWVVAE